MDTLGGGGEQVHLDPARLPVVEAVMSPGLGGEVAVDGSIHDAENVAIELAGDAGGVVVGRLEDSPVLDEVHPQQEPAVGAQESPHLGEQRAPGGRIEIADRTAEEENEAAPDG